MEKTIDCMGMACPAPVINAKKAIETFTEDGELTVKVDNEIAVQSLSRLASHKGFEVKSVKNGEADFAVVMQVKAGTAEGAAAEEGWSCAPDARNKSTVVVLSSNLMGNGDETLGKKLMGAFVYALTSQDSVPDKIICYNTGVYLTTEGSPVLDDLKSLEAAGVTIMSCGTCLDFYGLKEKLQVGIVSNMYDIVEAQMNAVTIIRP